MDPNTIPKTWFDRAKLSTLREFFAYLLVVYFLWQNKEIEREKTEILKAQVEVLSREKETQIKLLEITQKIINRNHASEDSNNPNSN